MSAGGLRIEDWFGPTGLAGFVRNNLGEKPFFAPGRPELADHLVETLGVASVEDLLKLHRPVVNAWLSMPEGHSTAAPVPLESAGRFHDAGATLFFERIGEFAPYERELGEAFGVSGKSGVIQVFCNRPGARTAVHFDPIDIITIQLTGRKVWRIAPNTYAPEPLDGWSPGEAVYPALRSHAQGPPPTEMPAGATEYVLDPGAVMYFPRGYWHDTISDRDSISLHFELIPPLRMDRLLGALKLELRRERQWREPIYLTDRQEDIQAELEILRHAVDRLDARDIVRDQPCGGTSEFADTFVRAGQASFGIDGPIGAATRVGITAYGFRETQTSTLELASEFIPACEWVSSLPTGSPLDAAAILQASPQLDKAEAAHLLALLERTHLIRRTADR